jgi:hypothetical protein
VSWPDCASVSTRSKQATVSEARHAGTEKSPGTPGVIGVTRDEGPPSAGLLACGKTAAAREVAPPQTESRLAAALDNGLSGHLGAFRIGGSTVRLSNL